MRIDYDLIEKINDEIYDNDDFYNKNKKSNIFLAFIYNLL